MHGHARTLALLAPSLRQPGRRGHPRVTRGADSRDGEANSRAAGSNLSSPAWSFPCAACRQRTETGRACSGCFTAGSNSEWSDNDAVGKGTWLAGPRVGRTGLATPNPYNHLTLNPALCPYLRGQMDAAECETLTARWIEAMRAYVRFLDQQRDQNTEVAATLTVLELPNLFALLDLVQRAGIRRRHRFGQFAFRLLHSPASRGCSSAWGRCAMPQPKRSAGRGLESRAV